MESELNFEGMSVNDLKKYCKENGIKSISGLKKTNIIDKIKEHYNMKKETILENSSNENTSNNIKFIDLFCGIGGFHLALKKLGCQCVLACDIDKKCRETYLKNFGIEPVSNIKDIDEKTMPDFDILCGGFPCQPFSNGGKKKSFDDDRGLLFDEIMRIANYKKPKFMFLENVKHILKVSNGEVFNYIVEKIKNNGYELQLFQLSPHNYGIPQQRERVFFVCVRKDIYNGKEIKLNETMYNISINDIMKEKDEKYLIQNDIKKVLDAWNELIKKFEINEKISPTILIHDYFRKYSKEEYDELPYWKKDYMSKNKPLLEKYKLIVTEWYEKNKEILSKREIYGKLEWQVGKIKENDDIYNYFIQIRQSGIRVKKPEYFPTLVAISQIPIYGKTKSYISPRQCARLQSFPESFILDKNDKVVYKQMGNSVNVSNVIMVIESTLNHYNLLKQSE
jgi:DNA (cytosine-5)-methyltransferase 1